MSKNTYWVADSAGVKALVEGVAERDQWTRVHGWAEATEPAAGDFVWMQHAESGGRAKFPVEAAEQWTGLGWELTAPVPAPDLTKDPVFVDQPAATVPVAVAETPKTASATGGEKSKETSRG
jgi:hypothetical protein